MNQFHVTSKPVHITADQADPKSVVCSGNGPLFYGPDREVNAGKLEKGERLDITKHTWVAGRGHLASVHVLVIALNE